MTQLTQDPIEESGIFREIIGASCEIPSRELMWEYACQDCEITFETTVPRGPSEERRMKCPSCDSAKIKRINIVKLSHSTCGG